MNFTCQRPEALYGLLLLIPASIFAIIKYMKVIESYNKITIKEEDSIEAKRIKRFPITIALKSVCMMLFWVMLVLAYAGFSWGTYLEPVQKSGKAVSLVFDISYSMQAEDAPGGISRLEAAKKYASMLISHMDRTAISVVVAKGDGVVLVPLTEDRSVVDTLLDSLSPQLMSSVGTSLGKGLKAALKSFPANSSQANTIWFFTDGDETDGLLESALSECIKSGVSVFLIGFGSERESKIISGDGKTPVMTALRLENLKKACASVMKKNAASHISDLQVSYIDATEPGSALELLESIKKKTENTNIYSDADEKNDEFFVTYELKPVQRYKIFLGIGIFFLALGFIISELNPDGIASRLHKHSTVSIIFLLLMLTSCKERVSGAGTILQSTWNWYQQRYNDSVAGFFQTAYEADLIGDELLEQYAVYDLAVTYLSQNENDAALERFAQIVDNADSSVKYATLYNCGIIAYRKGDFESAAHYFREAMKIDGSKINAKINLELSLKNSEKEARAKENGISQVSETNDSDTLEKAIFERIREYDKRQWKNSEKTEKSTSTMDY
ncbi:MAG: VWA domain-containing protein [Treponema sp.]|nr:VWA domain-containing protein [Treponema sp.]